MTQETARIYTIEEAAEYLRSTPMTVWRLLRKGEIEGFRVGTGWRIRQDALDQFTRGRVSSRTSA